MKNKFVIINHHRSGSNYLCRLLKANKDVRCLNEPLTQHMSFFDKYDLFEMDSESSKKFVNEFDRKYLNRLREYIINSPNIAGFKETCLYGKLGWLFDEFPDIKVIHLVRNPMAVINSCLRNDIWKQWNYDEVINRYNKENGAELIKSPIELCAQSWKIRNKLYMKEIGDHSELTVRLEDLILNSEETIAKVMNYLGAEVSEEQAIFIKDSYNASNGKAYSVYKDKNNVLNEWRDKFNDETVEKLQEMLLPEMQRYGYIKESTAR